MPAPSPHRYTALLALALTSAGCTKQAVEIEVRDPGRVQVTSRGPVPVTVLLPDGRDAVVPLPAAGERQASVSRRERTIAVEWSALGRRVELVDADGMFPATQTEQGISLSGPLLYADYQVTERRAFEPGAA